MKKLMTRFKVWAKPYMKPSMFVSFGIAWLITNGWAYLFIAIGTPAMRKIGIGYIALLFMPFMVEKIVTIAIAVWIEKLLFGRKKQDKTMKMNPRHLKAKSE